MALDGTLARLREMDSISNRPDLPNELISRMPDGAVVTACLLRSVSIGLSSVITVEIPRYRYIHANSVCMHFTQRTDEEMRAASGV